jgi:hypothetical protein
MWEKEKETVTVSVQKLLDDRPIWKTILLETHNLCQPQMPKAECELE